MPSLTTNFSLNKPLVNNATDQDLWGGYLNDNFDTIDTQLLLCRDWKKREITSNDTIVAGDRHKIIKADATTGVITLGATACATLADGFSVMVTKTDASANAVTIDPNGSEKVGGATTYSLTGQGDSVILVCDGANLHIAGAKTTPSAVAAASTTAAGIIEIAETTEVQAGSSPTLAVTPGEMKNALGFSKYYDSGNQAISASSQTVLTHGLGAIPKLATLELVCTVSDLSYSVGDRVSLSTLVQPISGTDPGIVVAYNTTQIIINYGSALRLTPNGGGEGDVIIASSWRLVARAWA